MNDNPSYCTDEDDFYNYNHPYDIMTGERMSSRYKALPRREWPKPKWPTCDKYKFRKLDPITDTYSLTQMTISLPSMR